MIDLDSSITQAQQDHLGPWSEEQAILLVNELIARLDLHVDYEPPDEEWIRFGSSQMGGGMLSVRLPLAIVWPTDAAIRTEIGNNVVTVAVDDFAGEELRASPELLRSTLLPHWCQDFDTESFSANDLFVESV